MFWFFFNAMSVTLVDVLYEQEGFGEIQKYRMLFSESQTNFSPCMGKE